MDVRQIVGKNLRRLRLERGISQEALALEAGVARGYMSGLERGVKNPTIGLLSRIAEVLDCKLTDMVAEPKKQVPKNLPRGRVLR